MARSSYIYIVVERACDDANDLIAAFTVKHEMMSWLEEHSADCWFRYWWCLRKPDGLHQRAGGGVELGRAMQLIAKENE